MTITVNNIFYPTQSLMKPTWQLKTYLILYTTSLSVNAHNITMRININHIGISIISQRSFSTV